MTKMALSGDSTSFTTDSEPMKHDNQGQSANDFLKLTTIISCETHHIRGQRFKPVFIIYSIVVESGWLERVNWNRIYHGIISGGYCLSPRVQIV